MKAEKDTREIERVVKDTETVVTLTLTENEAVALAAVVSRIQGYDYDYNSKYNIRSVVTNQIYQELHRLGYAQLGKFSELYFKFRASIANYNRLTTHND